MPGHTKLATLQAVPRAIWWLGIVSLLMDLSSEMIHALLPAYLVVGLGASVLAVGIVEGIAEATASITKVFSGAISDLTGRRKPLALLGYGLAAITKPVFPLAGSLGVIVAARFVDRIGKGIRGAPRDALVADLAPAHLRGASFGLRQSLDTVGAFLGPLVAIAAMLMSNDSFVTVFWIACIPAFVAVAVLALGVDEPEPKRQGVARPRLSWSDVPAVGTGVWVVTGLAALFTLGRFSEAFLILRAQADGVPLAMLPLVLVAMNIAYAASALPVGIISDGPGGRLRMLAAGMVLLIAADLALGLMPGLPGLCVGIVLWGLHMGFTQGVFAAMVADAAPERLRATAFGVFNLVTGLCLLAASTIAGALWTAYGMQWTFLAGAGFAGLTLLIVLVWRPK